MHESLLYELVPEWSWLRCNFRPTKAQTGDVEGLVGGVGVDAFVENSNVRVHWLYRGTGRTQPYGK